MADILVIVLLRDKRVHLEVLHLVVHLDKPWVASGRAVHNLGIDGECQVTGEGSPSQRQGLWGDGDDRPTHTLFR